MFGPPQGGERETIAMSVRVLDGAHVCDGSSWNLYDGSSWNLQDGSSWNLQDGSSWNLYDGSSWN